MEKIKIFISSVQQEFTEERIALNDYILSDPLLGRFFETFVFELLPALDKTPGAVYLKEVEFSHIYLGLFGCEYGYEDEEGISPTEREFNEATKLHKTRLIFLTNHSLSDRENKQQVFLKKVDQSIIRKKFGSISELKTSVYSALVNYLLNKEIIRSTPFDASINDFASIKPDFIQDDLFKTVIWRISTNSGEVSGEVPIEVEKVVLVLDGEMKRIDIQRTLQLKHDDYFRLNYILPAINLGLIEMKYPNSLKHPNQRYLLTLRGERLKKGLLNKSV